MLIPRRLSFDLAAGMASALVHDARPTGNVFMLVHCTMQPSVYVCMLPDALRQLVDTACNGHLLTKAHNYDVKRIYAASRCP